MAATAEADAVIAVLGDAERTWRHGAPQLELAHAQFLIKMPSGDTVTVETVHLDQTVLDLKRAISAKHRMPVEEQRLEHAGRQLIDARTLAASGLSGGASIDLLLRLRGGESQGSESETDESGSQGVSVPMDVDVDEYADAYDGVSDAALAGAAQVVG